MSKITTYGALTTPASNDVLPVVDVSDTTMASTGTTKKIAVSDLLAGAGSGTVTAVSVASANGFAGTVANDTSTPAVTVETTVTGLLKGNGTAVSAASAGTDYLAPAGDGSALTGLTEAQVSGLTADLAAKAPLASPALSGSPTAPTQTAGDGSTKIATTAYADAAAAAGLHAWQFRPEDYGAKGDGKVLGDGVTASNTTFTSASAGFTSGDTGKYIMIHGANGSGSGPLITTITYVNSTTVTLGSAAGASVSDCPFVYGTDDTTAVNDAVQAAGTYALAAAYFAEVLFAAAIYILASGPAQTGDGSTTPTFNAQIPLPYPAADGTSQKMVIALTGAGDAGFVQYWESLVPGVTGAALVSMVTAPSTPDSTYGHQSVVGGPSGSAGFTSSLGTPFANVKAVVKGLSVWCPQYTNMYAWDFGYVSAMRVQQSSAHIFAPPGANSSAVQPWLNQITSSAFTTSIGTGFRTPVNQNNDDSVMDDCTAEGYEAGFRVYDHFTAGRLAALYCDVAMIAQNEGGVGHLISVQSMSAEVYNGGLLCNAGGGGTAQIDIHWDAECTDGSVAYDFKDANGDLHGSFYFRDPADSSRTPVFSGVVNVRFIWEENVPGYWSGAPAVPATTVAQQNTAWRDATVYITSGGAAVSEIAVDGQATGLTLDTSGAVAVRVPSGKNITLTYASTAPTWVWVLE